MANSITLAKAYTQVVDEVYKAESKSTVLNSNAGLARRREREGDPGPEGQRDRRVVGTVVAYGYPDDAANAELRGLAADVVAATQA